MPQLVTIVFHLSCLSFTKWLMWVGGWVGVCCVCVCVFYSQLIVIGISISKSRKHILIWVAYVKNKSRRRSLTLLLNVTQMSSHFWKSRTNVIGPYIHGRFLLIFKKDNIQLMYMEYYFPIPLYYIVFSCIYVGVNFSGLTKTEMLVEICIHGIGLAAIR